MPLPDSPVLYPPLVVPTSSLVFIARRNTVNNGSGNSLGTKLPPPTRLGVHNFRDIGVCKWEGPAV